MIKGMADNDQRLASVPNAGTFASAWSKEELEAYVVSAGIITMPTDAAVARFLYDAVSCVPLPLNSTASRDESGLLFFHDSISQESSTQHPYELAMRLLAVVCRESCALPKEQRAAHIGKMHDAWTHEAQSMYTSVVAKWASVQAPDSDQLYYHNQETGETVWENPGEVLTAPYHLMLTAIVTLLDENYVSLLSDSQQSADFSFSSPGGQLSSSEGSSPSGTEGKRKSRYGNRLSAGLQRIRRATSPGRFLRGPVDKEALPAKVKSSENVGTKWGDPHVKWTETECSEYISSLGLTEPPHADAVRCFLMDVLINAPPPTPWVAVRESAPNGKDKLLFKNDSTQEMARIHPHEHFFPQLAKVCRECTGLSPDERYLHICSLHASWTAEAAEAVAKWEPQMSRSQNKKYYKHKDTGATMWEDPSDAVLPEFFVRLQAIGWLADSDYVQMLAKEAANKDTGSQGARLRSESPQTTQRPSLKQKLRRSLLWNNPADQPDESESVGVKSVSSTAPPDTGSAPVTKDRRKGIPEGAQDGCEERTRQPGTGMSLDISTESESTVASRTGVPSAWHVSGADGVQPHAVGAVYDRTVLSGSRWINGSAQWSELECMNYVSSLNLSSNMAVTGFLRDSICAASPPPPWIAVRDERGVLVFQDPVKETVSYEHPLAHVLPFLAVVCQECLQLPPERRYEHIRSLHESLKAEAEAALQKWQHVSDEAGSPYYYDLETRETMWENPSDALLPSYQVRLQAIGQLSDNAYLDSLQSGASPSRGPNKEPSHASSKEVHSTVQFSRPQSAGAISRNSSPSSARFRAQSEDQKVEDWSAYIRSLGLVELPAEAAILAFLDDIVASLFQKLGNASHDTYDDVLQVLAKACRECLKLDMAQRHARVTELHTSWNAEAQEKLSKWHPKTSRSNSQQYFFNSESGETMWADPSEMILPPYSVRLEAINRLVDVKYLWKLKSAEEKSDSATQGLRAIPTVQDAARIAAPEVGSSIDPAATSPLLVGTAPRSAAAQSSREANNLTTSQAAVVHDNTEAVHEASKTRGRSSERSVYNAVDTSENTGPDPVQRGQAPSTLSPTAAHENAQWTEQERRDYIRRLGLASKTGDEGIMRFLEDVLAGESIQLPWVAVRSERGGLFFRNLSTKAVSWGHPHERVLKQLSEACDGCLKLHGHGRTAYAHSLHASLTQETETSLAKWVSKLSRQKNKEYYQNIETGDTTWQNPAEVLKPASMFRLKALERLFDDAYCDSLQPVKSCIKGSASRETTAEPTAVRSEFSETSRSAIHSGLSPAADSLALGGQGTADTTPSNDCQMQQYEHDEHEDEHQRHQQHDHLTQGEEHNQEHHHQHAHHHQRHRKHEGQDEPCRDDVHHRPDKNEGQHVHHHQPPNEKDDDMYSNFDMAESDHGPQDHCDQQDDEGAYHPGAHHKEQPHHQRSAVDGTRSDHSSAGSVGQHANEAALHDVVDRMKSEIQELMQVHEAKDRQLNHLEHRLEQESTRSRKDIDGMRVEMRALAEQVHAREPPGATDVVVESAVNSLRIKHSRLLSSLQDEHQQLEEELEKEKVAQRGHQRGNRVEILKLREEHDDLLAQLDKQVAAQRLEMRHLLERIETSQVSLEHESSPNTSKQSPGESQSHIMPGLRDEHCQLQVQLDKYQVVLQDQQKDYLERISALGEGTKEFQTQLDSLNVLQRNQQSRHQEDLMQLQEAQHTFQDHLAQQTESLEQIQASASEEQEQSQELRPRGNKLNLLLELQDGHRELQAQLGTCNTLLQDQRKGHLGEISKLVEDQEDFQTQLAKQMAAQRSQQKACLDEVSNVRQDQEDLKAKFEKHSSSQHSLQKTHIDEVSKILEEKQDHKALLNEQRGPQRSHAPGHLDEVPRLREDQEDLKAQLEKQSMLQRNQHRAHMDEVAKIQEEQKEHKALLDKQSAVKRPSEPGHLGEVSRLRELEEDLSAQLEKQSSSQRNQHKAHIDEVAKLHEEQQDLRLLLDKQRTLQRSQEAGHLSEVSKISDEQQNLQAQLQKQGALQRTQEVYNLEETAKLRGEQQELQLQLEREQRLHRNKQQVHSNEISELEQARVRMASEMQHDRLEIKHIKNSFADFHEEQSAAFGDLCKAAEREQKRLQETFEAQQALGLEEQLAQGSEFAGVSCKLKRDLEELEVSKASASCFQQQAESIVSLLEKEMKASAIERASQSELCAEEAQAVAVETQLLKLEMRQALQAFQQERMMSKTDLARCQEEWLDGRHRAQGEALFERESRERLHAILIAKLEEEAASLQVKATRWQSTLSHLEADMQQTSQEQCAQLKADAVQRSECEEELQRSMLRLAELTESHSKVQRDQQRESAVCLEQWQAEHVAFDRDARNELQTHKLASSQMHTNHADLTKTWHEELANLRGEHASDKSHWTSELKTEEAAMEARLRELVLAKNREELNVLRQDGDAVRRQLQGDRSALSEMMEKMNAQSAIDRSHRDVTCSRLEDGIEQVARVEQRLTMTLTAQEVQTMNAQRTLQSSFQDILQSSLAPVTMQLTESDRRHAQDFRLAEKGLEDVRSQFESEARCLKRTETEILQAQSRMQEALQTKIADGVETCRVQTSRLQEAHMSDSAVARQVADAQRKLENELRQAASKAVDTDWRLQQLEGQQTRSLQEQQRFFAELQQARIAERRWQDAEVQSKQLELQETQEKQWALELALEAERIAWASGNAEQADNESTARRSRSHLNLIEAKNNASQLEQLPTERRRPESAGAGGRALTGRTQGSLRYR